MTQANVLTPPASDGPVAALDRLLHGADPFTALAPMQDVTDLPFWKLIAEHGAPDVFFTEYFRVYPGACLDKNILRSVQENPTGRPAIAQLIGNDIPSLTRAAKELQQHDVAAIDLNLGCPAPVVYRKCAGGGLLRTPDQVDAILGALRDAVTVKFTVKTRLGFDSSEGFDRLLEVFSKHAIDLLTVHGRTVAEMYRSAVHYPLIARAAAAARCPVLANGDVYSVARARQVLEWTGAAGWMIGRGAIRNPWLFRQIREWRAGRPVFEPVGRDVLGYLERLYEVTPPPGLPERARVQKIKKYLNYVGVGVEPTGEFLHRARRATAECELFSIFREFLDHGDPMPLEPLNLPLKPTDLMACAPSNSSRTSALGA